LGVKTPSSRKAAAAAIRGSLRITQQELFPYYPCRSGPSKLAQKIEKSVGFSKIAKPVDLKYRQGDVSPH